MMKVSASLWDELVAVFSAAEVEARKAQEVADLEPLPANDVGEESEAEQLYARLRAIADEHEDRVLGVVAPTVEGAALQLRLFGLRYHGVDVSAAPLEEEDPEAAILRRIYAALIP